MRDIGDIGMVAVRLTRITADIDTTDMKAILRCLKVFRRHGYIKEIEVHTSPSKKGYHITAWCNHEGYPIEKLVQIRRKAGDDKIRCDLDLKGSRQVNVLFTRKTKKKTKV